MVINKLIRSAFLTASASLAFACAACATDPPAPVPAASSARTATSPAPATTPEAKAEADAVSHLEKKFQEAARGYRKVEKNSQTLYCKKEKPMGSTVPRTQCITESQLRTQVEQMDDLRDRMRNSGRCTHGTGCASGG